MDELRPDDPLLALLDDFTVAGSDIENRVMAQLARDEEPSALSSEFAELRTEVAALHAEIAELKRMLASGRDAPPASPTSDLRGRTLLPYARPEKTLPILN